MKPQASLNAFDRNLRKVFIRERVISLTARMYLILLDSGRSIFSLPESEKNRYGLAKFLSLRHPFTPFSEPYQNKTFSYH
jgi:hypothetical protein